MELRQLRYFLMLAKELHFKRAADKLFIVQPALTKQIQELEKEIGVSLFERNKRMVRITEAGVYFQQQVGTLIDGLEKAKKDTVHIAHGQMGELRIGYVGSCIHTFLPGLLARLHKKYPQLQTYLSEMTTAHQMEAVKKGDLDIAFVRNPKPDKSLQQQLIFRETFSVILPLGHWLHKNNFKGVAQLASELFILPTISDGELYHQLQWSICEDAGFTPKIAHETVHGNTTIKLVENNLGVSLLPTSFKKITKAAVKFIELKNIKQQAEITAVWDIKDPNPALQRFVELL